MRKRRPLKAAFISLGGLFIADNEETAARRCDQPGCNGVGLYRAPQSYDRLDRYYWFCLDHVRAYNQAWNYGAQMNEDEIETHRQMDTTGWRPTWPLGGRMKRHGHDPDAGVWRDPFDILSGRARAHREHKNTGPKGENSQSQGDPRSPKGDVPEGYLQALSVLGLDMPISPETLKVRYKELVKRYHPDANGGDKKAEERLKLINEAYAVLKPLAGPFIGKA